MVTCWSGAGGTADIGAFSSEDMICMQSIAKIAETTKRL